MGWEIGFFIGALILLGALIYGAIANTRRNRANDPVTDEATRQLYKNEDTFAEKEGEFRAQTRR